MADEYRSDSDRQGGPGPSQQGQQGYNYGYKYNYSYGSGRGTAPGGHKPPRQDDNWGEWIGIGVLLLVVVVGRSLAGNPAVIAKFGRLRAGRKGKKEQAAA